MASTLAKAVLPLVAAASLAGGAVALTANTGTGGDCDKPYDRQAFFGSVPSPAARRASIDAATNADGQVIDFYAGTPITGTPDIDHVYSLSQSWPETCSWTRVERRSFANSAINLRPTSASLNRSKGDQSPAEWSPADRGSACRYSVLYLRVAATYKLPVSEEDADAAVSACDVATTP